MAFEISYLAGIVIFLAVLGFIDSFLPANLQILNAFDFVNLGGNILFVAGTCVISTGLPCAAALGVFAILQLIFYFIIPSTFVFVKPLIVIPITLIIVYIVAKLGRGGG